MIIMSQLAKLQNTFQNCVLNTDTKTAPATSWVSASGRADPETQISIYNYAYHARLKEVLANDFPATLMAIGEDYFNQLADDYIKTYPSHYFSLRDFGSHLPGFIENLIQQNNTHNEQWQNMPWAYELATFEWTLGNAFDAEDVNLFTEQDMATIPPDAWPDLTFTLHPSVHRLDFDWNIAEMWKALTNEDPIEVTAQAEPTSSWIVWREQLITRFRSMEMGEHLSLDRILQGGSFNDLCETLSAIIEEDEVPMHAATYLKGWITQGLISEIHLN